MSNETRQTRDQIRVKLAWEMTQKATSAKNFATACKKTSSRILTSGLAPTLAFCLAKSGEEEQRLVAESLARHLSDHDDGEKLLKKLISSGADRLRQDTEEAMAFLTWLARLAEGRSKKEKQRGGTQ